jgi:hypothetical protein
MAKKGASGESRLSQHAFPSTLWVYRKIKTDFIEKYATEWPFGAPSLKVPSHLKHIKWKDTRALFRTLFNRTPSDPLQIEETPQYNHDNS